MRTLCILFVSFFAAHGLASLLIELIHRLILRLRREWLENIQYTLTLVDSTHRLAPVTLRLPASELPDLITKLRKDLDDIFRGKGLEKIGKEGSHDREG